MAEAIVSGVLEQLISVISKEIQQGVRPAGDVKKQVQKLRSNFEAIQAVLIDAEQRQVKDTSVRRWLDQLKDASYDVEDVLDEWNTAITKLQIVGGNENKAIVPRKQVCSFFPSCFFSIKEVVLCHDIAHKIKKINENLDGIAKQKDMLHFNMIQAIERPERVPTISLVDLSEICGRNDEKDILVSKLLSKGNIEQKDLEIISIVGLGGIGKTTLAQFAYNDSRVMNSFDERIWVCVSNPFDVYRIAKAIFEVLKPSNEALEGFVEFNSLIEKIHGSIKGKKFLLVLDDVWTEDYQEWKPFHRCLSNGSHGSKVLITTRKESVAHMMKSFNIINVKELSDEDNWSLFRQLAFFERPSYECERLEDIGRKIVSKCKGLPLATRTVGSLLRFKKSREEWLHILNSEMWKLEEVEKGIFSTLLLSYNDLPSIIKRCFLYCAVFPKDHDINKDRLINLWMAQGYIGLEKNTEMEINGQKYFDHLAARSFFQDFEKDDYGNVLSCKMHDIVHDFAQFLSNEECFQVEVNGMDEPFQNSSFHKVRHSMLTIAYDAPFPESVYSVKGLRSLLLVEFSGYSTGDISLLKLSSEFTRLRALDINKGIGERYYSNVIAKEIGNFMHLRYLNLSKNWFQKLPETLCELCTLQTLDVSGCSLLRELPQGIGKLINLRHLINNGTKSLRYMPIGIKRLTCLRTLRRFVISESHVGEENRAANLECLKDLKHLQGKLRIRGLRNLGNVKSIQVLKNKNLFCLSLNFLKVVDWERINEEDELILEAFHPPLNVEVLIVKNYSGKAFKSSWMFTLMLRELYLSVILDCKHLSSLGKLSLLEKLSIYTMRKVKRMDNEFWGIKDDGISSSSSSDVLFPKLKRLHFSHVDEWEEWDHWNLRKEEDIRFMPCLASLSVRFCHRLKALPDNLLQRTTLKELEIFRCYKILTPGGYEENRRELWFKISHIPNIRLDDEYVQGSPFEIISDNCNYLKPRSY